MDGKPCEIKKTTIKFMINSPGKTSFVQKSEAIMNDTKHRTMGEYCASVFPEQFENGKVKEGNIFTIHGVELDMDTPLYWALLNLVCIDGFVYIVLVANK